MTNAELIATIREEIERLYKYNSRPYSEDRWNLGYDRACEDMMEFLVDLEKQTKGVHNPIFDECVANVDPEVRGEVRENIDRMLEDDSLIDEIKNFIEEYGYERGEDKLLIAIVARHFYELGCRRTAEKYDEIEYNRQREESVPNDLEEAAKNYALNTAEDSEQYSARYLGYKDGAKWQKEQDEKEQADLFTIVALDAAQRAKEQMLKGAVEGEVVKDINNKLAVTAKNVNLDGFKFGEKVRIIIVKE